MKEIYTIDQTGYIDWELYQLVEDDYKPGANEVDVPIPRSEIFIKHKWNTKKRMWEDVTMNEVERYELMKTIKKGAPE